MCVNGGAWSKLEGKLTARISICELDSPLPACKCQKHGGALGRQTVLLRERESTFSTQIVYFRLVYLGC